MPTYEYVCKECGHQWEAEQRITADPLKECPKCGAKAAKRQISQGSSFRLEGSCWARDGYK
jgi:putative FmdB family regulatory protein